jgi:cytochrome o ubiquinol oxidase subunit III
MSHFLEVHHEPEPFPDLSVPDPQQDSFAKVFFGFWLYIITDCLIFATLFITYAVLHNNTFGGPSSKEIFDLKSAFAQTMILLLSSVTCGFAMLSAVKKNTFSTIAWLGVTFLLGAAFIAWELTEFTHLVHEGYSWTRSAFLSSFFTLVGTHGTHISFGLLWIVVMILQLLYHKINPDTFRRLVVFSLFWHFLDLVWIFIFTYVYLMGVL